MKFGFTEMARKGIKSENKEGSPRSTGYRIHRRCKHTIDAGKRLGSSVQWKLRGVEFTENKQKTVNNSGNKGRKESAASQLHKVLAKSEG